MTERGWQPEPEIEQHLRDLSAHLDFPRTPPLAAAVRARVSASAPRAASRWEVFVASRRRLAFAALAFALATVAVLVVWPTARAAVADALGLRGIAISFRPGAPGTPLVFTPTSAPTGAPPGPPLAIPPAPPEASPASASAAPTPAGGLLRLGTPLSLEEVRRRVPYRVLTPMLPELGAPDGVYFLNSVPGGQVGLVYGSRPGIPEAQTGVGLLFTQFRAEIDFRFLGKGLGPGTRLEEVAVNGRRGLWIEGQPHTFFYRGRDGQPQPESVRLAGNVLLWEQDALLLRLEAAIAKDEALRIATSVR
ncbi:MAG: hypothetical protein HY329_23140 [Chloroflexi bacterium]|nr:hypothetical protein [Chloroflexota bacterium]